MKNNKPLFTIFLIVFIDLMGFGLILPLLPFIAEKFSANPEQIGLLAATYSLFQFLSAPVLGRLSDKYGRKKLLVLSQLGTFFGFILLGFANTLPLLFLARIIDGITGGNISIAQAYIADSTTRENRAKGMGLIGAAFGLGFIIGPSMGGLLSNYGYAVPAFVAAGISLITMVVTTLFLKESVNVTKTKHAPKTRFNLNRLKVVFSNQVLLRFTLTFFILNLAFSTFQGMFSLWTQKLFAWGPQQIGLVFGAVGVLAVLVQLKLLPVMVKHFGEFRTLSIGLPLLGLGFFWLIVSPTVFVVYAAHLFIATGNGLSGPTLQALATEEVHQSEYGGVMGMFQSAGSLGRIGGPMIGGVLFALHPSAPISIAALGVFAGYLVVRSIQPRRPEVHPIQPE